MVWEKLVVLEVPPLVYIPFLKGMLTSHDEFLVVFQNKICEYYNEEETKIKDSRKLAEQIRTDEGYVDRYWQWVNEISERALKMAEEKKRIDFSSKSDLEIWQHLDDIFNIIRELGSTVTYARFEPANILKAHLVGKGLSDADANKVLMSVVQPTMRSIASIERACFSRRVELLKKRSIACRYFGIRTLV
ncbi:MAG: hypothetical protein QW112_02145 [Candidatus Micrarchaeia archaeon]